jgi:hypothetical protein
VWQEIDASGRHCHSWRDVDARSVAAMSFLVLSLVLLGVVLLVAEVVATVRHDGYGSLEPPRSHPHDADLPGWPGRLA